MTYFDPHIYCKQNLKEEDLKEMEYWKRVFEDTINNAKIAYDEEGDILDDIRKKVIDSFCEELEKSLNEQMQAQLEGCIESYEGDIEKVENPETFD